MLDLSHLPLPLGTPRDLQIFTDQTTVTNQQWHTWTKPRGVTMCYMLSIGGGGGGGGGFGTTAGTAAGGGGGGAGAGNSILLIPAFFVPDILCIQVGLGGAGVSSGTGGSGGFSIISIAYDTAVMNTMLISSGTAAGGGGTATTSAGAASGTAASAATIAQCPLSGAGIRIFFAGQQGTTGGTAAGTAQTIQSLGGLTQGGGGGSGRTAADTASGGCTAFAPVVAGNPVKISDARAVGAGTALPGSDNAQLWQPFFSFGGQGAGGTNTTVGRAGGNGRFGSGGGGGGAGVTTGGKGGDGGGGLVLIASW